MSTLQDRTTAPVAIDFPPKTLLARILDRVYGTTPGPALITIAERRAYLLKLLRKRWFVKLYPGYEPRYERNKSAGPLAFLYRDKHLAAAGLVDQGKTIGPILDFFNLTHYAIDRSACWCVNGFSQTDSGRRIAARLEDHWRFGLDR